MYRFMSKQFIVLFAGLLVLCSIQFISPPKMRGLILTRKTGTRVLKGGGGGGGGSDPISQCYFVKNPIPIKDFFKIPTHISNVVYNNKPIK